MYFSGTPTAALAWGATLSALEVVPLVLIGYQAMKDLKISRRTDWARKYHWPIYFFIAVGFWNLVGAGLFGFMINPPIALFYMQGLNTTAVHAHAALFGVYGMLGLGLTLMCLRALQADREWKEGLLRFSFWAMNGGLMAMIVLSLLPVGLLQTVASVKHGYWYARSSEFLGQGLRRVLGDELAGEHGRQQRPGKQAEGGLLEHHRDRYERYERILKKRFPTGTTSPADTGKLLSLRIGLRYERMVAEWCEEAITALSAMSLAGDMREGTG